MVGDWLLGDGFGDWWSVLFFGLFVGAVQFCNTIFYFRNSPCAELEPFNRDSPFSLSLTMSSETMTCSGCDSTFSLRGYHSHLAQTQDPLCLAILDVKPVPFQGDAFETVEDPFGPAALSEQSDDEDMAHSGPDDAGPTALSEQSDDEDGNEEMAHMVAELEQSWEPHRGGAPRLEVEDIQVNDSDNEGDTQCRNIN